ncbi:MAG: LUD domain-containing protein [Armatimonadetes bacterium]|nr:LUD domain-containing protein [Armatimonadota bacterium]
MDQDIAGLWGEPSTCDDIWQAAAGVTGTVCAVAHSGTLLVTAGTGRKRMASLAPPVHIALVDKIVLTLDQAMRLVPQQTSVLVTGPSRTADIEGVLVNGVHGPGQLCVVILEDCVVEDTASGG